jgi:hypothetical protein
MPTARRAILSARLRPDIDFDIQSRPKDVDEPATRSWTDLRSINIRAGASGRWLSSLLPRLWRRAD